MMIKKNIIKNSPSPVGNYPHSIELNGLLYLSGVGPRNYLDNLVQGNQYDENENLVNYDIEEQTHAVFKNVKTILQKSNSSWNNLIDITVFLIDMKNDFKKFNKIYNLYFPKSHACRTTLEVNALPTDIAIELKCIAVIKEGK
jgi:2-aminomuconate deaminase